MKDEDLKFMAEFGKRLGSIENRLTALETVKPQPVVPRLPTNSKKANKFFGASEEPQGCNSSVTFKTTNISPDVIQETEKVQKMLKNMITEFCEEFDVEEFSLIYKDSTPPKEK